MHSYDGSTILNMSPVNYVGFYLQLLQLSRAHMLLLTGGGREVEIGGVGEIMKRSQSVTQRLLSASTEEDQTNPRSEARHENCHEHAFLYCFMNTDQCA